jgi:hypothetical protein
VALCGSVCYGKEGLDALKATAPLAQPIIREDANQPGVV